MMTPHPRTINEQAATAALAHTEGNSWRNAIRAANRMMATTIGHTRRPLLLACCDGNDGSISAATRSGALVKLRVLSRCLAEVRAFGLHVNGVEPVSYTHLTLPTSDLV